MQPVYYNYNIVLIDLGKISNKNYLSFMFYYNKTIYNVLLRINHVPNNTLIRKIIKASFYSVKRFFYGETPLSETTLVIMIGSLIVVSQ